MSTSRDVEQLMRQTRRYWYADGFADIGFGVFILLIGLLFIAEVVTPPGSALWLVWGLGGPLLLIGGGILAGRVVHLLKERASWPRTGYVEYDKPHGKSRAFRLALTAIVAAAVSAAMIIVQKNWLSFPVIIGVVYLLAFCFIAYRFGLWRYVVLAAWCLGLGLALAPQPLTVEQSGAIFHLGTGLALLLAGWLTWRRYDQSAPPPQEAIDGRGSR